MTRYAGSIAVVVAAVAEEGEEEVVVVAAAGDDGDLRDCPLLHHLRSLTFRSGSTRRRELDRAAGVRYSNSPSGAGVCRLFLETELPSRFRAGRGHFREPSSGADCCGNP